MEARVLLAGSVVINEFMADNETRLKDSFNQPSDWIELRNLDGTPVDLTGWHLTDAKGTPSKWTFPAGTTLPAGGYLVVFASSRDVKTPAGELHTNFKISSAAGGYLGLTDPAGVTVHEYASYPKQYADVSYGLGTQVSTTNLIGPSATGKWFVPMSASALDPNWPKLGFGETNWATGTTGLGFDTSPAGTGRLAVLEARGTSAVGNVQDAVNLILAREETGTRYPASTVNFVDPQAGAAGHFAGDVPFGGNTAGTDDNFAVRVRGTFRVTTAGQYTFGVYGDDGFSLSIKGATFTSVTNATNAAGTGKLEYAGGPAAGDTLGVTTLAPGEYDFDLHYFDGTGSAGVEFFAAAGAKTAYDTSFRLVGDAAGGGLPLLGVADTLASNPSFRPAAQNVNASAFLRVPFTLASPADVSSLNLAMRYDDGFVAYLNGQEVLRVNAPDEDAWNAAALTDRQTGEAVRYEDFDLSEYVGLLLAGQNVLAIQGLNGGVGDADFVLSPKLSVTAPAQGLAGFRYFVGPTPRASNGSGSAGLGPIVTDVSTPKARPGDADAIVVTARVRAATYAVSGAPTLVYQVMYNGEIWTPMWDDGPAGGHSDAVAGDGVWTGVIPASASGPGQMVRWYVRATDNQGQTGRWPVVVPVVGNDAGPDYEGTVIADPSVGSSLPVFDWFTQNPTGANGSGARGSVYYLGEFYDNVFIRRRGGASTVGNKIKFNSGYDFKYAEDQPRVNELNLNGRGSRDTAYVRPVIGMETFRDLGVPASTVVPMRVNLNGIFDKIGLYVEQVDNRLFERVGWYEDGALYKMASDNPRMDNANVTEKKNREEEGRTDLADFFNGIHLTGAAQTKYLFDNVNLPVMIDYLVANTLVNDNDDAQKNYFLYRDTNDGANAFYQGANAKGTNEWTMLPWDKDLTFGMHYSHSPYGAADPYTHPFFADSNHPKADGPGAWNWFIDAVLDTPQLKEMYLRRLRTAMDEMLQPLGTPVKNRYYEQRLDELFATLSGDPFFTGSSLSALSTAFNELKTRYLDPRRVHLFVDHSINTAYPDYAGIPGQQNANPAITFGAYDASPASGDQDHEYVQLVNPNAFAVDISDWRLGGGIDYTFKKGTVIPAGGTLYVSPNVYAFRSRPGRPPTAVEFVQGNYDGQLSSRGETVTLTDRRGNAVATLTTGSAPSAAQQSLRVTEVMFHPADPPAGSLYEADEFEFLEIKNVGASAVGLSGVRLTDGVYFDFTGGNVQTLAPGGYALVVANLAAFQARYGNAFNGIIAGTFAPAPGETVRSGLNNAGERVRLVDAQGETIVSFDYEDGWNTQADGRGNSLVIRNASAAADTWDEEESWSASGVANGTPGAGDTIAVGPRAVVINEVMANAVTDPRGQWIELRNTTGADINIGGWYLSNEADDLQKYRIAAGTILPANGYLAFNQISNFGNTGDPGRLKTLTLDAAGGSVYLTSASGTVLTGYQASEEFGASARDVPLGRYVTSTGEKDFVALATPTYGTANAAPMNGPVVISEVMFHPAKGFDAYVELRNVTGAAVNLFDPANPANTWRLAEGIDFAFPTGASIPANGYALVVKTDPAYFRSKYGIPASVPIFGPFRDALDNGGDTVELRRPGEPATAGAAAPYYRVDQVEYADRSPWPVDADGFGASLNRINLGAYGDDVANWQPGRGTPGGAFAAFDTTPPSVPTGLASTQVSSTQTNLSWSPATDAQSGVAFYYVYANGKRLGATATTTFSDTWVNPAAPRVYQISAVNLDGVESAMSGTVLSASVLAVTPDPRSTPVGQMTIVFNAPVTGFDLADLTLTRDGGPNLLTGAQTLTTTNNLNWTLGNLAGVTSAAGDYVLTLKAAGSGVAAASAGSLAADATDRWTIFQAVPTATITPVAPDPRRAPVDSIAIVFSEAVSNFDLSDLTLRRDGGANLLTAAQTLTSSDGGVTWLLGNLGGLTGAAGNYVVTLKAAGSGIVTVLGGALAADATEAWTFDLTAPTVAVTPIAPDPRSAPVDQVTIVFSEAVPTFDRSDLVLRRDGGANLLTAAQTLTSVDGVTWVLGNLGGLTNLRGTYQLDVVAGPGVADVAGNALANGAGESWFMSVTLITPFDTTDDRLGTVTVQGENLPNEGKDKAFDNSSGTKWLDFATSNPSTRASWIQYQYAAGKTYIVTQYTITSANDRPERDPRDWQLLGSNDGGATWTVLDTRSGETFASRFQKRTFSVANSTPYNTYRLTISSVASPGNPLANSVQLAEIELIGLPPLPPTVTNATYDYKTARSLSFQFSKDVRPSLGLADVQVRNLTTNEDVTPSGMSYDVATNTATFTFASLPDGNYTATLSGTGIADGQGRGLDGDYNGTGGDPFVYSFFALAGDANHDRTVGFADLLALARNYGKAGTFEQGDFNYSGTADFADLLELAKKYGKSLPAPGPAGAAPVTGLVVTGSTQVPSLASVIAAPNGQPPSAPEATVTRTAATPVAKPAPPTAVSKPAVVLAPTPVPVLPPPPKIAAPAVTRATAAPILFGTRKILE